MKLTDRDYERLIAYAARELPPESEVEVERELLRNPDAAATVARYRQAIATTRADESVAPPAETLAAAKALFRAPAPAPSLFDRLKRVLAELVYDSRTQPALVGVRGANQTYQLSFESAIGEIDVQVESSGAAVGEPQRHVTGQLTLDQGGTLERVILTGAGSDEPVATAAISPGGVFTLTTGPGSFDLWVALADTVVIVPDVEIR